MPPIKTVFAIQFITANPKYNAPIICISRVRVSVGETPVLFKISFGKICLLQSVEIFSLGQVPFFYYFNMMQFMPRNVVNECPN